VAGTFHPAVSVLLQSLSAAIGETVQLDVHGECSLEFEAGVDLVLAQAGEPRILSLRSALMATGQAPDADMLQACCRSTTHTCHPAIASRWTRTATS